MKDIILNLKSEVNFDFEEFNIEQNEFLHKKYREKIPVLMLNGRMIAKYRIDKNKLVKLLKTNLNL